MGILFYSSHNTLLKYLAFDNFFTPQIFWIQRNFVLYFNFFPFPISFVLYDCSTVVLMIPYEVSWHGVVMSEMWQFSHEWHLILNFSSEKSLSWKCLYSNSIMNKTLFSGQFDVCLFDVYYTYHIYVFFYDCAKCALVGMSFMITFNNFFLRFYLILQSYFKLPCLFTFLL